MARCSTAAARFRSLVGPVRRSASARTRCSTARPATAELAAFHASTISKALSAAAQVVAELIRDNYPDLNVPFHARWRHFVVGARDLWAERAAQATWPSRRREGARRIRSRDHLGAARCRRRAGLAISRSRHRTGHHALRRARGREPAHVRGGRVFGRSRRSAARRRRAARCSSTHEELADGFQSMVGNPLVGVEGRADLLAALGAAVAAKPEVFARAGSRAPGRALRPSRGASRDTAACPRRASSKRCSNISGRSGRAG